MPIYDQSYRPYRGTFSSHSTRWWTITRTGVMQLLGLRKFIVLLCAMFIYPVVCAFQIYFVHRFPEQNLELLRVDAEFFRRLVDIQTLWFVVLGIYPGTGLISNDLKGNAIQLYLSKPLTRIDYVLGKFGILATFMLGVTMVPGLILFALEIGFSSDLQPVSALWWVPFGIVAYSLLATVSWALTVLALSATSRNSRYVGILLLATVIFTSGFAQFLRGVLNLSGAIVLSIFDDLRQLTHLFLGGVSEFGDHRLGAAVVLLLLAGAAILVLRARVRAVEVVT